MTLLDPALTVPAITVRDRISDAAIQSVVRQICDQFQPRKIILFGSYAYGVPSPESDVDLLVIMETARSELSQAVEICQKINYKFGLDLIVLTPSKLIQRLEWGDSFLNEIMSRGVVLYEAANA